jgi:hypothetical protein
MEIAPVNWDALDGSNNPQQHPPQLPHRESGIRLWGSGQKRKEFTCGGRAYLEFMRVRSHQASMLRYSSVSQSRKMASPRRPAYIATPLEGVRKRQSREGEIDG